MANEIIKGMGFHHIAVKALDFEAALKFYTEGLGFEIFKTFTASNGKSEMVATFLAVLELVKGKRVRIDGDGDNATVRMIEEDRR